EKIGGVLGAVELVRGGLIDRHGDRAGRRVGPPTRVEDESFGLLCLVGHCMALQWFVGIKGRGGEAWKENIRAPNVALALLGEKRFEKTIVEAAKAAGAG